MSHPISYRVGAFILRKNAGDRQELLLFKPANQTTAPLRVPGGGIEPGESAEQALYREIYEESGLKDVKILRNLGSLQRCWLDTRKVVCRHYFLLEAQSITPDSWEHIVEGEGPDAGMCFSFCWYQPNHFFKLEGGAGSFLNPAFIPELYNIPSDRHEVPPFKLRTLALKTQPIRKNGARQICTP